MSTTIPGPITMYVFPDDALEALTALRSALVEAGDVHVVGDQSLMGSMQGELEAVKAAGYTVRTSTTGIPGMVVQTRSKVRVTDAEGGVVEGNRPPAAVYLGPLPEYIPQPQLLPNGFQVEVNGSIKPGVAIAFTDQGYADQFVRQFMEVDGPEPAASSRDEQVPAGSNVEAKE